MLTTILYIILAILILTTLYVVVRTIIFQRSHGAVEKIEGVPVDDQQVAEHLAASVRCQTVPLDEKARLTRRRSSSFTRCWRRPTPWCTRS